ncbi:MAG: DUF2656 family protein [Synechococcus sp. SP1 MAG]|jgi:hypothetical protein|nr:DUF2656 family protein [Synechococcus sp. SP1 MAG]
MTIFVLSHNLQVQSALVPSISAADLAEGLLSSSSSFSKAEALSHPHWLVRIESDLAAHEMAQELVKAWKQYRLIKKHNVDHHWLALGGRKDTSGSPGSPLTLGSWGVDVVECGNPDAFLESINWNALKAGRPSDAVFEVTNSI